MDHPSNICKACSEPHYLRRKWPWGASDNERDDLVRELIYLSRKMFTDCRSIPMIYGSLLMFLALYRATVLLKAQPGMSTYGLIKILVRDQVVYFLACVCPFQNYSATSVNFPGNTQCHTRQRVCNCFQSHTNISHTLRQYSDCAR